MLKTENKHIFNITFIICHEIVMLMHITVGPLFIRKIKKNCKMRNKHCLL